MKMENLPNTGINSKPHFLVMRLRMPESQPIDHEAISFYTNPYYVPVQPRNNACSHCALNSPGPNSSRLAFYTYPCDKQHLSHESCFKIYMESHSWKKGCLLCVKEFGIPLPQAEVELQQHKIAIKCSLIGYLFLIFIIFFGVIFLVGFQQHWW